MKELQRERELVAKKAGKSGLRKVGAVTSSGRVSGGSEDFLPPPLPARERRHTHAGKGEGKTRHTSPSLTPASGSNMAQSHEERKTQNSDIHSWAPLDKVLGAGFGGMGHAPPRPPSRSTRGPSPIEESGRWSAELFKAGMIAAASPSALDADESPTPYGQRVPLDMLYEV
ncbi:MAG: hypothetical protein P4L40_25370 [Terracidiphilus sp.]|nr:hypothetical protein [Terracidiphilus sp.]